MAELAPMFVDPFYYQREPFGLCEGYVDVEGKVWMTEGGRAVQASVVIVRPAYGGGYYARAVIGSMVFYADGDTPGHAAADLMIKVNDSAIILTERAFAMKEEARASS
jgi:hypothetical protein